MNSRSSHSYVIPRDEPCGPGRRHCPAQREVFWNGIYAMAAIIVLSVLCYAIHRIGKAHGSEVSRVVVPR